MKCKKCKEEIADGSIFCNWCGVAQVKALKKSMYQRPDGLYEKNMTIDGKRKVFRGKTEREVLQKIADFEGNKERGRLFSIVADEWKGSTWERVTYNTANGYRAPYERAVNYFAGRYASEITTEEVKDFIFDFVNKGYAQKTVKNHLLVLHQIFDHAVVKGDVQFNPVDNVRIPKNLPKTKRLAPTDYERKIVEENVDIEFGLFPIFILLTGCRLGEALAIQGSDIHRKEKTLNISKSVYWESTTPRIKTPKTSAGIRIVPMPDLLLEHLPPLKANEYLFGKVSPMKKGIYESTWARYRRTTGLSITPHQLRHGYATLLYEAGVDVKDAQYLLGHSNIAMTLDIYTHISNSKKAKTMTQFNDFLNDNNNRKTQ